MMLFCILFSGLGKVPWNDEEAMSGFLQSVWKQLLGETRQNPTYSENDQAMC